MGNSFPQTFQFCLLNFHICHALFNLVKPFIHFVKLFSNLLLQPVYALVKPLTLT